MCIFKVFYFILLGMLLILANAKAEVYDDEGKVITENEIKTEITEFHSIRPGTCCLGCGCIFGVYLCSYGAMADALSGLGNSGEEGIGETQNYILITGGVTVIVLCYVVKNILDRNEAVERIKEQRRIQKHNEDKESLVPDTKLVLPILSMRF